MYGAILKANLTVMEIGAFSLRFIPIQGTGELLSVYCYVVVSFDCSVNLFSLELYPNTRGLSVNR